MLLMPYEKKSMEKNSLINSDFSIEFASYFLKHNTMDYKVLDMGLAAW